jgi:hypothetical protein
MKKLFLVPAALAALTVGAFAQAASDGAGAPSMTGNPGLNNQQSDQNNQPNAPSRPRNLGKTNPAAADNGAADDGAMNSTATPSNTMPNTTQSVAPGSAPQGSNMPQMAKPKPRNSDRSEPEKP